jgi:hypothetical protein
MKITSKKLLTALVLLAIAASPMHAQTNEQAELEATNTAEVVTNVPAATAKPIEKKSDSTPVRIDQTGIHVGGTDPVDINFPAGFHGNGPTVLIPIIAILMVFGMPIAIVGMFFYFRHRKSRMLHETLRAMVEKGVAIPPELLTPPSQDRGINNLPADHAVPHEKKDMRHGVILIGIGAGVTALCGKPGLIILFIGVAMVVVGLIEKRNKPHPPTDK